MENGKELFSLWRENNPSWRFWNLLFVSNKEAILKHKVEGQFPELRKFFGQCE